MLSRGSYRIYLRGTKVQMSLLTVSQNLKDKEKIFYDLKFFQKDFKNLLGNSCIWYVIIFPFLDHCEKNNSTAASNQKLLASSSKENNDITEHVVEHKSLNKCKLLGIHKHSQDQEAIQMVRIRLSIKETIVLRKMEFHGTPKNSKAKTYYVHSLLQ